MPWMSEQLHNSLVALELNERLSELLRHRRCVLETEPCGFAANDAKKDMLAAVDIEIGAIIGAVT